MLENNTKNEGKTKNKKKSNQSVSFKIFLRVSKAFSLILFEVSFFKKKPEEINYRVLAAGASATRTNSEENYQFFKREYKKACNEYNIPFPEFLN